MELVCYRDSPLQQEPRLLPAATYNLAHTLLARSVNGVVFVPIRSMQYLAVIDREEIIFLDAANKSWVEIAWQNFRPQQRNALDQSVSYAAVFYKPAARETMQRLQVEFPPALKTLAAKDAPTTIARIIKLDRKLSG